MGANEKSAATFGDHKCHALRCTTSVPPKMFMCRKHWYMVPKPLRDLIWHHYRPGQEIDKDPSQAYVQVAVAAVNAVADKEGISHGTSV